MTPQTNVENQLREMILNFDLSPGERITERWAESALSAHIRASRDRTLYALTRNQRTLRARGVNLS